MGEPIPAYYEPSLTQLTPPRQLDGHFTLPVPLHSLHFSVAIALVIFFLPWHTSHTIVP
jgi:hypothetical protein